MAAASWDTVPHSMTMLMVGLRHRFAPIKRKKDAKEKERTKDTLIERTKERQKGKEAGKRRKPMREGGRKERRKRIIK